MSPACWKRAYRDSTSCLLQYIYGNVCSIYQHQLIFNNNNIIIIILLSSITAAVASPSPSNCLHRSRAAPVQASPLLHCRSPGSLWTASVSPCIHLPHPCPHLLSHGTHFTGSMYIAPFIELECQAYYIKQRFMYCNSQEVVVGPRVLAHASPCFQHATLTWMLEWPYYRERAIYPTNFLWFGRKN